MAKIRTRIVPVKRLFVLLCGYNNLDSTLVKMSWWSSGITSYRMSIKIPFVGNQGRSEVIDLKR